jgi:hypothetical protein
MRTLTSPFLAGQSCLGRKTMRSEQADPALPGRHGSRRDSAEWCGSAHRPTVCCQRTFLGVSPRTEVDVVPNGKCTGTEPGRHLRGVVVRMHTHLAEVVPETRLEEAADRCRGRVTIASLPTDQPRRRAAPSQPRPTPTPRHPGNQSRMKPTSQQNAGALGNRPDPPYAPCLSATDADCVDRDQPDWRGCRDVGEMPGHVESLAGSTRRISTS